MLMQQRLRLAVLGIGTVLVTGAAAWAWGNPDDTDLSTEPTDQVGSVTQQDHSVRPLSVPIDPADFDTDLWRVPREPVVVTAPAPPPLPDLELLGITTRNGQPAAMIFDPESDTMITLIAGESHGPTTIVGIRHSSVDCIAHDRAFTLALGEGAS